MHVGYLNTRVARRVFALFVACALVPVVAAGVMTVRGLAELAERSTDERLARFSKNYGMGLVDRLTAADAVSAALSRLPDESLAELRHNPHARALVASVRRVPDAAETGLALSAAQRAALADGRPVLRFVADAPGRPALAIVAHRSRNGGGLVEATLDVEGLWGAPSELPEGIGVVVVDDARRALYASDPAIAPLAIAALGTPGRDADFRHPSWEQGGDRVPARAWPLFLDGAFAAPPLTIVAYAADRDALEPLGDYRITVPAVLALTIAALVWLALASIRRQLAPLEDLVQGTSRLAELDFTTPVAVRGNDEFAALATSFNAMSGSLQRQFAALESLAEIDRMLLRTPDLETVLDALLRRIETLLGCTSVSVLLVDADAPQLGRIYDYVRGELDARPVRRVAIDRAELAEIARNGPLGTLERDERLAQLFELDDRPDATSASQIHAIWNGAELAGFLCLGGEISGTPAERMRRGRELADRIAVVLVNLAHRAQLHRQAHYDELTALPNRATFRLRLDAQLRRCRETSRRAALLYVDLDHFKRVNDTSGHSAGDALLRVVADRLAGCVKDGDVVARLGGDEFAILVHEVVDRDVVRAIAERVVARLADPIQVAGRDHYISASVGVALVPEDGRTIEDLLKHGDIAMYRAKDAGRGRAVFFDPEMNARMLARAALETGLHRALRLRQFQLHYQPICRGADGVPFAVEALMRWPRPGVEPPVSPSEFIPIAEDGGLIVELGAWALEQGLRDFAGWRRRGLALEYVSINVSPRQLAEPGFATRVRGLLGACELPPPALQIEITEGVLSEGETTAAALRELAAAGVRIAIDDFGTGYSSLSYLREYPICTVKIDRSFIVDVPGNESATRLAETILLVGRGLDKRIVAEGVETEEQYRFLRERGCDAVQGYFFARPQPAGALETYLVRAAASEYEAVS